MKLMQLILMTGLCLTVASAQQQPAQQQGEGHGGGQHAHGMPSVDDQVKMLSQRLDLTDDQQAKIKPILEDQHTQMQALMKDSSLSPTDRQDKARGIHDQTHAKIRDVLTDDQKKKFDAMQAEMHEHMQHHPPSQSGNPPPPK
jgi:Spy/CpxP family protein refolding chaperone